MSEKTLPRAAVLAYFTRNAPDPRVGPAVEAALAGLGWADKAEFGRDDMLALTWRLASDFQQDLAATPNPEAAAAGQALAPLVELTRTHVARATQR
jgi:hypothetical protein